MKRLNWTWWIHETPNSALHQCQTGFMQMRTARTQHGERCVLFTGTLGNQMELSHVLMQKLCIAIKLHIVIIITNSTSTRHQCGRLLLRLDLAQTNSDVWFNLFWFTHLNCAENQTTGVCWSKTDQSQGFGTITTLSGHHQGFKSESTHTHIIYMYTTACVGGFICREYYL